MEYGDRLTPLVVTVGDSPDARLFVELSSYGSDLTEAQHALDLAIRGKEEGPPMIDASAYLIGFAVVAYCRAILHSNVRGPLTDHIEVPTELMEIHHQVKTFRNATIAHSQSELSVTYPRCTRRPNARGAFCRGRDSDQPPPLAGGTGVPDACRGHAGTPR